LAIVKHIVERHRGRLEISSRQGEGTTASFLLPVQSPPRPAESDAEVAAHTPSQGHSSQNRNEPVT
ncbi:MAG: hypothetical protein ACRC1J_03530, partial [Sandaracinobacteroides sp.]